MVAFVVYKIFHYPDIGKCGHKTFGGRDNPDRLGQITGNEMPPVLLTRQCHRRYLLCPHLLMASCTPGGSVQETVFTLKYAVGELI